MADNRNRYKFQFNAGKSELGRPIVEQQVIDGDLVLSDNWSQENFAREIFQDLMDDYKKSSTANGDRSFKIKFTFKLFDTLQQEAVKEYQRYCFVSSLK